MGGKRKGPKKPCTTCTAEGLTNRNGAVNKAEAGGLCTRHWREDRYGSALVVPYAFKWLPADGDHDEVTVKRIALGASHDLPVACTKEEALEAVGIMIRLGLDTVEMTARIGCSIHMTELLRRIVTKRNRILAA